MFDTPHPSIYDVCCARTGLKKVNAQMQHDHNARKKEIEEEIERQFPLKSEAAKNAAATRNTPPPTS